MARLTVAGRPHASAARDDVLTGFVANDEAMGRPAGVAIARDGALLVADDIGNVVWRVASATTAARTASEKNRADTIAGESSAHGP